MEITQDFYDQLAAEYDRLYEDWTAATKEHAAILDRLFQDYGFSCDARLLDCACGIGTQSIGLAALGYAVTASDISEAELAQAKKRAAERGAGICFVHADFRALSKCFSEQFDIVIAMDNALPHMLTRQALEAAVTSILESVRPGGIFAASIRDYDRALESKPSYAPPYIHKTGSGQRVSFQTWSWDGDLYHLTQYIISDEESLQISKYECAYRAVRREELTNLLRSAGCHDVFWKFPEETGFFQPIVIARKPLSV